MSKVVYIPVAKKCDFDCPSDAKYDAKTGPASLGRGSWANMCEKHWKMYGNGKLGTGFGQELIVGEEPVTDESVRRNEIHQAIADGDFDLAEELIGDGDMAEWL